MVGGGGGIERVCLKYYNCDVLMIILGKVGYWLWLGGRNGYGV